MRTNLAAPVALVVTTSLFGSACFLDRAGRLELDSTDESSGGADGQSDVGGSSASSMATCNDGALQSGEACDGDDLDGKSCEQMGFTGGMLSCAANCAFDTSACRDSLCGNGALDDGEGCDESASPIMSCQLEGFATGTAACSPTTCELSGCIDHYTEKFETATAWDAFTSNGNAPWASSGTQPYEGALSATSGDVANGERSAMSLTLQFDVAGEISFWYRTDSESDFDYLYMFIDNVERDRWSGDRNWAQATYAVVPGTHTFEWRYRKDGGVSVGADAAWIDEIITVNGYRAVVQ